MSPVENYLRHNSTPVMGISYNARARKTIQELLPYFNLLGNVGSHFYVNVSSSNDCRMFYIRGFGGFLIGPLITEDVRLLNGRT